MTEQLNVGAFLRALTHRTETFFREELAIALADPTFQTDDVQTLDLRHTTAIMSAAGELKLYLAYSFDAGLLDAAFAAYTQDLDIAEDERDDAVQETAGDIINIVVGNALADIAATGTSIALSPPIILTEAKSVMRHRAAKFASAELHAAGGALSIHLIGPGELFNDTLDYV
ncbi:MAG: chemotaxis protein CheX [Solidesulfovibrio sp. DCME]|uniref:chemotaxis protein CheX n=1 Tax=Solidesulfovibrio sp. DCME TaxID=3447380 RepID=UPI003D0A00DB